VTRVIFAEEEDIMRNIWTLITLAACTVTVEEKDPSDTGTPTETDADADADADSDTDADTDTTATNPDFAACAGDHSGGYTGDDAGTASAILHPDGTLEITFVSFTEIRSDATVDPDGTVHGSGMGVTIDGTYDFTDCSATGEWVDVYTNNGTWMLTHD
jgi:hypothetical protein